MTSPSAADPSGLRDYALDWALVGVETSGLTPRLHRVLSIAVVTIGPDGRRTGEFSTLLNPGGDPGPVHVHGLTSERLRGAPAFEEIAGPVAALLRDRVMVAHNAQFDYDFLTHEFARAGLLLPVSRRLCTLALNRLVDPPTPDLRLGTLAAHYGVPQPKAHDALDDTRVLAGVLRAGLREAARLGLALPLVVCPPRQDAWFTPAPPRTPCAFRNPGRAAPGGPLTQGMKITITGHTATGRTELVARCVASGLNMTNTVSRHTSALVTNEPSADSAKARRAVAEGVLLLDEPTFLALLEDVRPGTPHEKPAVVGVRVETEMGTSTGTGTGMWADAEVEVEAEAEPALAAARRPQATAGAPGAEPGSRAATGAGSRAGLGAGSCPSAGLRPPAGSSIGSGWRSGSGSGPGSGFGFGSGSGFDEDKPLAGRRVLVLGGAHEDAAAARTRVVVLGGAAAVNLSASVTDVVLLPGGGEDRRFPRIVALRLPTHDSDWLMTPTLTPTLTSALTATPAGSGRERSARVLPRGGVLDLPGTGAVARWDVTASWAQQTTCEIDIVAFTVDEDEQVSCDGDFVFYGAPESPGGSVRLLSDGPTEQTVTIDLITMPPAVRKVIVAAAIDGTRAFGEVGAVQITAGPGGGAAPLTQVTLDAATTERTLLLAEIYRRGPRWRFRAVGQGYDHGLDALARSYGVDIAD